MLASNRSRVLVLVTLLALLALGAVACGGSDPGVVISTPEATATEPPPTATNTARPEAATATPTPSPRPTQPPPPTPIPEPTEIPTPEPTRDPFAGRWIDVDVSSFVVSLMDGDTVVQTIAPVAVGENIDTGDYLSTATGLYSVYSMNAALVYDAPFDTYISHWVGFDPGLDNGFHSFLKDEEGNVVDDGTGRISNGCIRTGAPELIYEWAEIGMPVLVHT